MIDFDKYKYGQKPISELSEDELRSCISALWQEREGHILEISTYKKMLASSFPVHIAWRSYAEMVLYVAFFAFLICTAVGAIK